MVPLLFATFKFWTVRNILQTERHPQYPLIFAENLKLHFLWHTVRLVSNWRILIASKRRKSTCMATFCLPVRLCSLPATVAASLMRASRLSTFSASSLRCWVSSSLKRTDEVEEGTSGTEAAAGKEKMY